MATHKQSKRRKHERDFSRQSTRNLGTGKYGREVVMAEVYGIFTIGHPRTRGEGWPIVDEDDINFIGLDDDPSSYWYDERSDEFYYDYLADLSEDAAYDAMRMDELREMAEDEDWLREEDPIDSRYDTDWFYGAGYPDDPHYGYGDDMEREDFYTKGDAEAEIDRQNAAAEAASADTAEA